MDMLPEPMLAPHRGHHTLTQGGNNAFHNFANDYSHISDPNLRRRLALSDIDKVPFGLYRMFSRVASSFCLSDVRAVAVAGVGFFLDSYDIFAINLITTFLGVVFWQGPPSEAVNGFGGNYGLLPSTVNTALKASTSAGIVIGQVIFGWLADVFGRRRMYGIELGIIVLSTLNCALASPSQAMSSTGLLIFWRVMMGVGIGGDYPLSAIITSEFAPTRWRGAMMAAVFSMQGVGQLAAAIVALCVTAGFKDSFITAVDVGDCGYACQVAADRSWRIIVGVGALPACIALYYRITIPETPRYTFDVAQDIEKADADIKAYMASKSGGKVDPVQQARMLKTMSPALTIPSASWSDVWAYFRLPRNFKILLGTTLSWFFLDLAFYGLGLNNTVVLAAIGYSHGPTLYHALYNNAVGMIILACAGSLPGYWAAVFTIDTLGRKPLQIIGFAVLTILFILLGLLNAHLSEAPLLVLYIAAQFFFNWGPNTTTFIVPGECFPTRYRSTGHGLSAASGKIGAILAQVISIPLLAQCNTTNFSESGESNTNKKCSPWLDRLMQIFALFMLLGTLTSLLIPETKGVTLEELAGETPRSHSSKDAAAAMAAAKWWKRPFLGGQPAGFWYKPSYSASTGSGNNSPWPGHSGRSPRVGIMTSPELAAMQQQAAAASQNTTKGSRGRKKNKKTTGSSGSNASSSAYYYPGDETPMMATAGVLPGWGAGWGRGADRSGSAFPSSSGRVSGASSGGGGGGAPGSPTSIDTIRLHDVGSLLR
ncbi:phosphate/H+ symporter [Podospora didyma]|uniref:Phosphate/H+ symporter n=1 Tax=Podospora didyma TaxID=330526 RepID=A0AAE0NYW5_9PEZI|nr:phosphate/H+ symporter [Podospora didyma]